MFDMTLARQKLKAELDRRRKKRCICEENDPCDYHMATCIICLSPCKGHPSK